ncbi:MAG: CO dehydrogenase/acetyl-CoA synthase subunit delta [Methanomicrobiales archaeon]|nr:CO dehydrogenase/acetyl-CoA synthase subunit delta [Methanomicrobiales archaeon]
MGEKKREKQADQPITLKLLSLLSGVERVELENVELEISELELFIPMGSIGVPAGTILPEHRRPASLIKEGFTPVWEKYPGRIREVTLGATKGNGGSRGSTVIVGGSTAPAFSSPDRLPPHSPVLALDVFDMKVPLPKTLKANVAEVMEDPAAWARMNVERFGAEMVTVHLMSTDPLIADRSPRQAAKTVEEVLQAVDVPLIIGGCGHPKKDAEVFSHVAEMASGERLLLNSVTLDMAEAKTLEGIARAAKDNGHALLAFTGLDLNSAKELNRRLYEYLPPEDIIIDLTTVALGYGLEYSFTIHERARLAALMGDAELQHPTISASTNAWAAREAWLDMDPKYGPREIRGPLWETLNGLTLLLAGVDLFMMMHPAAVNTVRSVAARLMQPGTVPEPAHDWVAMGV